MDQTCLFCSLVKITHLIRSLSRNESLEITSFFISLSQFKSSIKVTLKKQKTDIGI
ncbi:hypothetical protein URS_0447 [Acinetobacter ursingii]|nr:hypothetical protein URS_0447 [Acinetobacter ursingii]